MNLNKFKILKKDTPIEVAIFIVLIIALLLFDKEFSKLPIVNPLFVHDFLLAIATIFALNRSKLKFKFPSIFILIIISIAYLAYSLLFFNLTGDYFLMIFRQYYLFFYLICCYVIANKFLSKEEGINKALFFIKQIAKWSLVLQLGYFVFLYATIPGYSPFEGYSYLSGVAIMGLITFGAYALVYYKGYKRILFVIFMFLITALLGHASSFFAIFLVALLHFYISFPPRIRFMTVGILLIIIIILFQFPQFTDANTTWRLMYWSHVLSTAVLDNFLLLGNGFGSPYMTFDFARHIANQIGSTFMMTGVNIKLERWVSPPHNSFLTMIHHIGFIPTLLFFVPLKNFFKQIFLKSKTTDNEKLFLFYSLFGLIVWVSFNVILELPHSAIYFWFVYFTYLFYEKIKAKT